MRHANGEAYTPIHLPPHSVPPCLRVIRSGLRPPDCLTRAERSETGPEGAEGQGAKRPATAETQRGGTTEPERSAVSVPPGRRHESAGRLSSRQGGGECGPPTADLICRSIPLPLRVSVPPCENIRNPGPGYTAETAGSGTPGPGMPHTETQRHKGGDGRKEKPGRSAVSGPPGRRHEFAGHLSFREGGGECDPPTAGPIRRSVPPPASCLRASV